MFVVCYLEFEQLSSLYLSNLFAPFGQVRRGQIVMASYGWLEEAERGSVLFSVRVRSLLTDAGVVHARILLAVFISSFFK